ncbi:hypothetical protein WR25_14557 [Diploscapter pachys]|uniref:PX domain-containing protein n=1 Tax=Diploscapter pachys TaxID=2018661 RepID=A0A2A2L4U6_9BILA|nr:hypothetical protein WR25_14557 [Diploscapter pachys]
MARFRHSTSLYKELEGMQRTPSFSIDVVVSEDKKTVVYIVKIENGQNIQRRFEDYERFYNKIRDLLPSHIATPPRRRILQNDIRLQEKRKLWIAQMTQTLFENNPNE